MLTESCGEPDSRSSSSRTVLPFASEPTAIRLGALVRSVETCLSAEVRVAAAGLRLHAWFPWEGPRRRRTGTRDADLDAPTLCAKEHGRRRKATTLILDYVVYCGFSFEVIDSSALLVAGAFCMARIIADSFSPKRCWAFVTRARILASAARGLASGSNCFAVALACHGCVYSCSLLGHAEAATNGCLRPQESLFCRETISKVRRTCPSSCRRLAAFIAGNV